jgi:hypothetical protein
LFPGQLVGSLPQHSRDLLGRAVPTRLVVVGDLAGDLPDFEMRLVSCVVLKTPDEVREEEATELVAVRVTLDGQIGEAPKL